MDKKEFNEACKKFRLAKIAAKKAEKEMSRYYADIRAYATENGVNGDVEGLKFTPKYSFVLDANVEEAKRLGWALPEEHSLVISDVYTNKTKEELMTIAKEHGLKEDAVQTTVDRKKLEKMFEDAKVDASYTMNVSIGLSTVE